MSVERGGNKLKGFTDFHLKAEPADGEPGAVPPRALRGGISKSILQRRCQLLEINAH